MHKLVIVILCSCKLYLIFMCGSEINENENEWMAVVELAIGHGPFVKAGQFGPETGCKTSLVGYSAL